MLLTYLKHLDDVDRGVYQGLQEASVVFGIETLLHVQNQSCAAFFSVRSVEFFNSIEAT